MVFRNHLMIRLLLLLFMATAGGALNAAEGDIYELLHSSSLRKGPDSAYESVAVAKGGEHATELTRRGKWVKVRMSESGDVGWLYAYSLELVAAGSSQAVAVAEQAPSAPDVEVADVLNGEDSSVRSEAGQGAGDSLFVDGSVSADAEAVGSDVSGTTVDGDVAAADLPGGDEAPVSEPIAADATDLKPDEEKVVIRSGGQTIIEAGALDDVGAIAQVPAAVSEAAAVPAPVDMIDGASEQTPSDELVVSRNGQNVIEAEALTEQDASADAGPLTKAEVATEAPATEADSGMFVDGSGAEERASDITDAARAAGMEDADSSERIISRNGQNVIEAEVLADTVPAADMATAPVSDTPASDVVAAEASVPATVKEPVEAADTAIVEPGESSSDALVVSRNGQNVTESEALIDQATSTVIPPAPAPAKVMEAPAPVAEPEAAMAEVPAGTPASGTHEVVKTTTIRTGPGSLYEVLGWAGSGARVEAVEQQGNWLKVRMQESGRTGWVEMASLRPAGAVEAPMVATAPAQQEPAMEPEPQPAKPEAVAPPAPTVESVKPVPVTAAPAAEPVSVAEAPERNLFSFNRKANLRAGPDVKYDAVTWAGIGSFASELDRKGDWIRVQMQVSKRIGWVYKSSMDLVKAGMPRSGAVVRSAQVVEEPVASSAISRPAKAAENLYVFKRTSNLRAGPGKQYDVVAWGGRNATATEIDRKGEWQRVRMSISGKVGWVFNTLLSRAPASTTTAVAVAKPPVPTPQPAIKGGQLYQVVRTEPLRSDAIQFSELTGWVSRGESVALLEQRDGWMRVSPQTKGKQAGWIKADFLKPVGQTQVVAAKPVIDKRNVVAYRDRISRGETFNFSYAALEQALYRVPVEDMHIRIDRDDLKAIFRKDRYDKSSFDARIKTGRRNLYGTIKVLGSSTRVFKKKSLLIKLDKESGRWYGRRRIALRSMASDRALMREWMAWKMMAAMGMKVPEVHFTRVTFNKGERTGLYLSIEWMGNQFLEANGLNPKGEFYQPNDATFCGDLNTSENLGGCFDKITPRDDNYSNLKTMAEAVMSAPVASFDKTLATHFNDESVINWIAVNALVTNGDTYNKNYWLHYAPGQKWTVIPWDYNLTFGRVYDNYGDTDFKIFNDNFQYYYPPDVGASNPLKDKVLRNPKLRARLEAKIRHLIGLEPNGPEETFGWFSPTVMHARIGNLAAVVGKEVYKDTFLSYGEGEFTKTYESLMHYVTAHDHFLNVKLFGKYEWKPVDPNAPIIDQPLPGDLYGQGYVESGGESLHMVDSGWGYFVARMNLDTPLRARAEFKVHVEGGRTPKQLPPGQSARRCVERSWILSTQSPNVSAKGDLMLEYIQENSRRTEVPVTIHEELLELWVQDGNRWKPLKTEVNEYANTLTAKGVHFRSGRSQRFVACSPF